MREKIKNILTPPAPADAKYHGGVKGWKYYYSDESLNFMIDQIISTLIESLPEKRLPKVKIYDNTYGAEVLYAQGCNDYRSEVINLLRGTK